MSSWEKPPFYTTRASDIAEDSAASGEGGDDTTDAAAAAEEGQQQEQEQEQDEAAARSVPSKRGRRMSQIGAWVEYWDEASGSPYFVNETTGESSWDTPPGMAVQWS